MYTINSLTFSGRVIVTVSIVVVGAIFDSEGLLELETNKP